MYVQQQHSSGSVEVHGSLDDSDLLDLNGGLVPCQQQQLEGQESCWRGDYRRFIFGNVAFRLKNIVLQVY